ncbi:MAG: response regulator [Actinomycetales bacterium]
MNEEADAGGVASLPVLVCDDQAPLRLVLREIIDSLPRLHVVAEAGDAESCIQEAARTRPRLVVLDVRMPGGGEQAARDLRQLLPQVRIVVFSAEDDAATRAQLREAGADLYLSKAGGFDELVAVLEQQARDLAEQT